MRQTIQLNKKTYEKCTPLESEILDNQFDNDAYGWASEEEYLSPIEASLVRLEELMNQVLAPLLPDDLEIFMNRFGLRVIDHKHGVERYFDLRTVDPIGAKYSMATAKNEFEFVKAEAEAKAINEKTVLRRGEWWQMPDAKYNRYQMVFEKGGTVPCGLQSGHDNIPAYLGGRDCLIGLGEYIWSRPAIAALSKTFDLQEGTEICHHMHEYYRLKHGRNEANRRTYE